MTSSFNGLQLQTSTASTDSTTSISFAWFGSNQNNTGTWDYAPLDEFQETEPERFNAWKNRFDTDDSYRQQQIRMNQQHNIWYQQASTGTTNVHNPLTCYTFTTDGTSGNWTVTSDFDRFQSTRKWYDRRSIRNIKNIINKYLKLNRTAEEIQQEKAEKKSWELVKEWLSPEEFAELTSKGQMEIQSKEDLETIYIVKKDPLATVQEIKKGNKIKSMCLISKETGLPTGDSLLSKIMLLKTDEKQFKEIAVIRNLA